MAYPYIGQLAPAVGRALPGLPIKQTQAALAVTQLASSMKKKYINQVGMASATYSGGGYGAKPVLGTNITIMNEAGTLKAYTYDDAGIVLKSSSPNINSVTRPCSIPLPDGRIVAPSSTSVYALSIDKTTFAMTVSLLFTLPSTGTTTNGESFTTEATYCKRMQYGAEKNLFLTPCGNLAMVAGATIGSIYCIIHFEFNTSGTFLFAKKLFEPVVTTGVPTARNLDVYLIGSWYHYIFYDMGPGTSYTITMSYYAVPAALDAVATLVNYKQYSQNATYFVPFSMATTGAVMYGIYNTQTFYILQDFGWLIGTSSTGAPKPLAANTYNKLYQYTFGQISSVSTFYSLAYYREYCPVDGKYYANSTYGTISETPYSAVVVAGNTNYGLNQNYGNNYTYLVLDLQLNYSRVDALAVQFQDYVVSDGQQYGATDTEQNWGTSITDRVLQYCSPLLNGYWIGTTYNNNSANNRTQLYKEV